MSITIIGHRGMGPTPRSEDVNSEQPPENTIAAFDRAVKMGARGFECDIERLPSGELIVVHSATLKKIQEGQNPGKIKLSEVFNAENLCGIDLGGGNHVPTLKDVLNFASQSNGRKKGQFYVNLEVRDVATARESAREVGLFLDSGKLYSTEVSFSSFDWPSLEAIRCERKDIQLMPLVSTVQLFGQSAVGPDYSVKQGVPYRAGIFNELSAFHKDVRIIGVDMLMFDVRDQMIQYCSEQSLGLSVCSSSSVRNLQETKEFLKKLEWASLQPRIPFVIHKSNNPNEVSSVLSL